MKIYGLKNCDTCRKAKKQLEQKLENVELIDVRATPLSSEDLSRFLTLFGTAKLLNTRSTTWRGLSDEERNLEPSTLLAKYPALMKRPVIVDDENYHLGWSKTVQEELL